MNLRKIGKVKSQFKEPAHPDEMREQESIIILESEYVAGLDKIENNDYLQILFYLDKAEGYTLVGSRRMGEERGVFASRSPRRPNPIGVTTVKLLAKDGNMLRVKGLDAIDGTPVLDIKPYAYSMDQPDLDLSNPRLEINKLISQDNLKRLLIEAGKLHGHYCPFLSLGVRAAAYGLQQLNLSSDGMEDLLAVIETNSCFSDGVQFVSGCTFGNNGLIYRDYGKTAVTLIPRGGEGIRLHVKERENIINRDYPEVSQLFKKVIINREGTAAERKEIKAKWSDISFKLLTKDIEELFDIETGVKLELPAYAPIFEDEYCTVCGEKIMAPKAVKKGERVKCIYCANDDYFQLDGSGLSIKNRY